MRHCVSVESTWLEVNRAEAWSYKDLYINPKHLCVSMW